MCCITATGPLADSLSSRRLRQLTGSLGALTLTLTAQLLWFNYQNYPSGMTENLHRHTAQSRVCPFGKIKDFFSSECVFIVGLGLGSFR